MVATLTIRKAAHTSPSQNGTDPRAHQAAIAIDLNFPPADKKKTTAPAEETVSLPVLILFWLSAAALIDTALYEYLRAAWYLTLDHELPSQVGWLGIVFFPIGIGLIKRSPDSRSCFQTVIVLLILFLVMIGFELFDFGSTSIVDDAPGWGWIAGISIWGIAVLWYFKHYENYFNNPVLTHSEHRNETALIWFIIISATLSNLTMISSEYEHKKTVDSLFSVELDFYAVDSESDQFINNCSVNFERTNAQRNLSEHYSSFEKDGVRFPIWRISGFTGEPFKIEFSADDYETNEFTVTRESASSREDKIPIPPKPIPTEKPEDDQSAQD